MMRSGHTLFTTSSIDPAQTLFCQSEIELLTNDKLTATVNRMKILNAAKIVKSRFSSPKKVKLDQRSKK